MKIKMYTDGGARNNPGPAGIGVYICDENGVELIMHKDYIGEATNNVAEYCALIAGLEIVKDFNPVHLSCHLDSELVVKQMKGIYKVKHPKMKQLFSEVKSQLSSFKSVSFTHLPRENSNMKVADRLVNEALDNALMKKKFS